METPNISGADPTAPLDKSLTPPPAELQQDIAVALDKLDEPEEEVWEPDPIPSDPITLDDGSQVLFRQPSDFVARDIKPAMRAMAIAGMTGFVDAIAVRAIKSWTIKDRNGKHIKPPAVNPDAMDEMTPMQWNELARWLALYVPHFDPPRDRNGKRPTTA